MHEPFGVHCRTRVRAATRRLVPAVTRAQIVLYGLMKAMLHTLRGNNIGRFDRLLAVHYMEAGHTYQQRAAVLEKYIGALTDACVQHAISAHGVPIFLRVTHGMAEDCCHGR